MNQQADEVRAELAEARQQRGKALADNQPFDNRRVTELQERLEAADDLEAERIGRQRSTAAEARAKKRGEIKEQIEHAYERYCGSISQIEEAGLALQEALANALTEMRRINEHAAALGAARLAPDFAETARRLSAFVANQMRRLPGSSNGRFGILLLTHYPGRAGTSLYDDERRQTAAQVEQVLQHEPRRHGNGHDGGNGN